MAESPAAAQQGTPFDNILAQARDLACERLTDGVAEMLDKVEESLTTMIGETQNQEQQKLFGETRDKTLAHRDDVEKDFRSRYLKEFQTRTNRVKKIGQSIADIDLSTLELDLVAEDDLEESLKFNNMAAKLRRFCDEELNALDQRIGVLLGDADLQSEDNPFSPQAILDAYKHACKKVEGDMKVRLVLLKLFDDHVADAIRSVYKDVNSLLVKNSILPKIRYAVTRQEGGKGPAEDDEEEDEAKPASGKKEPPGEQDFFAMMQNLMKASGGGLPGGVPGAGGGQVVVLQGAELLSSLSRLQQGDLSGVTGAGGGALALPGAGEAGTTNVLKELKSSSVGAGMAQMDAMTLDIVSMLFDQLFDEPKIPIAVKGMLGRLQIPMLKVAIADKDFFSKKTHPARLLLDTLGDIAVRLPTDFSSASPLYAQIDTIVLGVLTGFQDNLDVFDKAREELQKIVAEEDKRTSAEADAAAKRLEQQEALAVAKTAAQEEIRSRVRPGKTWRPAVDFLVQHWVKFLLLVHIKRGKDSDVWKTAVETMDQLLWTIEPKNSPDDRKKLTAVVPVVVKRITAGLKAAGVEDKVGTNFLDELMKRHTDVLGPAAKEPAPAPAVPAAVGAAPAAAGAAAAKPGAAAPAKPGAPAAKPAAPEPVVESSLDFTASITVKNPFGGGEIAATDDMDFTGGASAPAPAAPGKGKRRGPSDAELTDSLAPGTWVEVLEKKNEDDAGTRRPARLSFVTPQKTRFQFVDRNGNPVLECSRGELARRMRIKEVTLMDEAPLFDRIMGGLIGKMKTPAAAH
jgi:exonuclease VII small subunit